MTHKEMTAHFRKRLKAARIPARVKMNEWCGVRIVSIVTPTYDKRFTAEQLKEIGIIAQVNGLTGARGSAIDLDNIVCLTEATQFNFEFRS